MQWKGAEPTLTTDRLTLRAFRMSDVADLAAIEGDPEVTYFRGFAPLTPEDTAKRLRKSIAGRRNASRTWLFWCVRDRKTDAFIGTTMLRILNREWRELEVGYALARPHWRKGYATEATVETLRFAFREFKAHRVLANCYPQNTASCQLLERLGFRKEAFQVESYHEHGEWQDNVQYALLDREFNL